MSLAEELRDRFPDFPTDLSMAIAVTKQSQPLGASIWFEYQLERQFKRVANNINAVAWGRKTNKQKLILYEESIILFSLSIQRLLALNLYSDYLNIEPLQKLYTELVSFLPEQKSIQLKLNLKLW